MKPPIIVDAKGELLFFKNASAAEGYIEEIDVKNGEYGEAYDSEGRLLRLTVQQRQTPMFGAVKLTGESVVLESAEETPTHGSDLQAQLIDFLRILGDEDTSISAMPLAELIHRTAQKAGIK
jgi:hypothetical protein